MVDSVLTIATRALSQIGFDTPATLVGSADDTAVQVLALLNQEADDLIRTHEWSVMTIQDARISLVANQELYPLPGDFDRMVRDTQWDKTNAWRTFGPDDAQTAQFRRNSPVNRYGPRRALRQVGSFVSCWPAPTTTGDMLSYDYVSNAWAQSAGGTLFPKVQLDADVPILPTWIMILGLKWRWLNAKGLDATAARTDWNIAVAKAIANDQGGGQIVSLSGCRSPFEASGDNTDGVIPAPTVSLPTS